MRDDFHLRDTSKPAQQAESAGVVRFFITREGPDDAEYPTTGNVVYAELLKNVKFDKELEATLEYEVTGVFDYVGCLTEELPEKGAVIKAMRIGARWWTDWVGDSFVRGHRGVGTDQCDPFICLEDVGPLDGCDACPNGARVWEFDVGIIVCGEGEEACEISGVQTVEYDDAGIWLSEEIECGDRTFQWQLEVTEDISTLSLLDVTGAPFTVQTWLKRTPWCCQCGNKVIAECAVEIPVPCTFSPILCLTPIRSTVDATCNTCSVMPKTWMLVVAGFATCAPGVEAVINGTFILEHTSDCEWASDGPGTTRWILKPGNNAYPGLEGWYLAFQVVGTPVGGIAYTIGYTVSSVPQDSGLPEDYECLDPLVTERLGVSSCTTSPATLTLTPI